MNILVIAPHADDEILGVGATMAKYINQGHNVFVCIVTRPVSPVFNDDFFNNIRQETLNAHSFLQIKKTFFLELPSVMLETIPRYEINKKLQDVVDEVRPDIVFIPHFGDMQKDHRMVSEAIMVAVRPKNANKVTKVYSYETLSETEWNIPHVCNAFLPTTYVDVSGFLDIKLQAMSFFQSQLSEFPNPRSLKAIESLACFRGSTILVNAAEAFMLIREIV